MNPAFERSHYSFGFHDPPYAGGGQDSRCALFDAYAARLRDTFGLFDMPMREAWTEANEILEGADVSWAYLRAAGPGSYHERLRENNPTIPAEDRSFLAHGTC